MIVWEDTGVPPPVKWLISLDCASPPLGTIVSIRPRANFSFVLSTPVPQQGDCPMATNRKRRGKYEVQVRRIGRKVE